MRITTCIKTVVVALVCMILAGGSPLQAAPQQDPNIRIVFAHGEGDNRTEALNNAFRDAVEQAAGLFCDTDTLSDSYQMVRDEVLTQSNGFIVKYATTRQQQTPRGLAIDIQAWVKVQEVTKRLMDLAPGAKVDQSNRYSALNARLQTESNRDAHALKLLKRELDSLDPIKQYFDIRLAKTEEGNPVLVKESRAGEGLVTLRYTLEIYPRRDLYFNVFVPRFTQILKQISVRAPRKFHLEVERKAAWRGMPTRWVFNDNTSRHQYKQIRNPKDIMDSAHVLHVQDNDWKLLGYSVSVMTRLNERKTAAVAYDFFLEKQIARSFYGWYRSYMEKECRRVNYLIQILNKEGEIVAQQPFEIDKNRLMGTMYNIGRCICIPMVLWHSSGGRDEYSDVYRFTQDVTIAQEDMEKAVTTRTCLADVANSEE